MAVTDNIDTLRVVTDSLMTSDKAESDWILHHIVDGKEIELPLLLGYVHIPQLPPVFGIDITPTKHVIFMWIAAFLVLFTFYFVAKNYKRSLIPGRMANFFEVLIIFVRDEIAELTLGKAYKPFLPFLLTLFFFILFGNFLGLIPFSATFTSNIAATTALAIISFFMIQLGGIKHTDFRLLQRISSTWYSNVAAAAYDTCRNSWIIHETFCIDDTTFRKYDSRSYCYPCSYRLNIFYGNNFYCATFQ